MTIRKALLMLLLISFTSCEYFQKQEGEGIVFARVLDKTLTYQEFLDRELNIPKDSADSVRFINRYVNRWVKDQLLLDRAEFNLSEQQKLFDWQIEDYRRDLLIFAYHQEYLKQNLDTVLSREVIEGYYDKNKEQFTLSEKIFQVEFAEFPANLSNNNRLKQLFFSAKATDREKFMDLALQYARNISVDDTVWYSFQDFVKLLPLLEGMESEISAGKTKIEISDEKSTYLVQLTAIRPKGSPAPLHYVESTIQSILLNQRKLQTLERLEQKLFKDGLSKNAVEIFK
ncbi:MAG: peptidyl-prolyl cis-trans isomerase [Cryomorphaceae bacterium]|nr:peptidyl-prolyl cis-trans isomerase [Cryomorphaceae bacterium]